MNTLWLLRLSKWARNPPSDRRVKLVLGTVAVAVLIVFAEWMGWWPEWAQADPKPRR